MEAWKANLACKSISGGMVEYVERKDCLMSEVITICT